MICGLDLLGVYRGWMGSAWARYDDISGRRTCATMDGHCECSEPSRDRASFHDDLEGTAGSFIREAC